MELLTGPNLAALLTLPGVGEKRALLLAERYRTWDLLLDATIDDLADTVGLRTATAIAGHLNTPPTHVLPTGTHVVSRYDPDYPANLTTIPDPPLLLWYQGTLPPARPLLAVVGTRTPAPFGASVAQRAATEAAQHHISTVSGLALGCDSIAHTATINEGLPTWAIVGQGIHTLPTNGERAALARRILDNGGGLLCEVPPDTPVAAHLLTKRNRLQAGTAAAVFIAQTGLASGPKPAGTLHTARYAIEQNRLLAVAAPPTALDGDPAFAGNRALTDPDGIDPNLLHVTDPALVATIHHRKPAADQTIRAVEDLTSLCAQLAGDPATT